MSLKQQLNDELNQRAISAAGDLQLVARQGALTMRIDLAAIESVGCNLNSIAIESTDLADASMERLHRISDGLTRQLRYLMEPLAEIESDVDCCTVQLRSTPPQRDGERRAYYELLVCRGGSVMLTRYEKTAGEPRVPVPASLTREVVLRLVGDLEAALS